MSTYGQFCPVAKAATVLTERWTLLILREFLCGSHRFNELERGLPGISHPLLAKRLRTLVECGIIVPATDVLGDGVGYDLTERGLELQPIVMGIGEWGQRWLNSGTVAAEIDTDLLLWDIHRRIDTSAIDQRRIVIQIDCTGAREKSYWLVIEPPEISICFDPPGFDVDLLVTADSQTLHDVWVGRSDLAHALQRELIRIEGPADLCREFPRWLQLSHFAHVPYRGTEPLRPVS